MDSYFTDEQVTANAMLELHRLQMQVEQMQKDQSYWYERAVEDEKSIDDLNTVIERLNGENEKLKADAAEFDEKSLELVRENGRLNTAFEDGQEEIKELNDTIDQLEGETDADFISRKKREDDDLK